MTTVYEPLSSFSWLDFDDREAQRMGEVLSVFDDRDTVDSLGLGVVRDSFSNQLFPGTSTNQTRARYFLFAPWICLQLEQGRVSPGQFPAKLREAEVALIGALRAGGVGGGEGMFGYRVRDRIRQLPTEVYWSGLGRLGILRRPATLEEYRRSLPHLDEWARRTERDDDGQLLTAPARAWDAGLPPAPAGFPASPTDLNLTAREAQYLADRIVSATATDGTLFAELAHRPEHVRGASAPWEVPQGRFDAPLVELLHHARCFSDTVYGASLLYNLILSERAEEVLGADHSSLIDDLELKLDDWAAAIEDRRPVLEAWRSDLARFWGIVERSGPVRRTTQRFVTRWFDQALADPAGVAGDAEVRAGIVQREHQLKGPLARLSHTAPLENWKGEPFAPDPLTFRWGIAKRILSDIARGLS